MWLIYDLIGWCWLNDVYVMFIIGWIIFCIKIFGCLVILWCVISANVCFIGGVIVNVEWLLFFVYNVLLVVIV